MIYVANIRHIYSAGMGRVDRQKGLDMITDRSTVSQALAKAIAFKNCGKDREAEQWARRLVELLECANILRQEH